MLIDLKGINWRKKLAVILWVLCVLGSFLPTSSSVYYTGTRSITGFSEISMIQRLIMLSVPLIMVWVGNWLLDDDESGLKRVVGILLELCGWIFFAKYIGFYLLGPLILSVS